MESRQARKPIVAFLGLGSSLGDRRRHLADALERLHAHAPDLRVTAVSPLYESPHMGLKPGDENRYPAHLNCAARIETTLEPDELLHCIHAVETRGQRVRDTRWGPRTIDIDILVYDSITVQSERLTLPHPEIARRAFVLLPLADLAPDLRLPDGMTIAELLRTRSIRSQQIARVLPDLEPPY